MQREHAKRVRALVEQKSAHRKPRNSDPLNHAPSSSPPEKAVVKSRATIQCADRTASASTARAFVTAIQSSSGLAYQSR